MTIFDCAISSGCIERIASPRCAILCCEGFGKLRVLLLKLELRLTVVKVEILNCIPSKAKAPVILLHLRHD